MQASPPPYPGHEQLSHSPGAASSDFGVDPMEEEEGEYSAVFLDTTNTSYNNDAIKGRCTYWFVLSSLIIN